MNKVLLFDRQQIDLIIERLSRQINSDFNGQDYTALVVLKGALFFAADLLRQLEADPIIEFAQLSSYVGNRSSGEIDCKLIPEIKTKNILIIEDICETGITLEFLKNKLIRDGCAVKICCLFDKPQKRKVDLSLDYVGVKLGNEFVIGYGFDLDQKYRNLRDVYCLA
jgi:hypoxanthine phosphoribosyltransferase